MKTLQELTWLVVVRITQIRMPPGPFGVANYMQNARLVAYEGDEAYLGTDLIKDNIKRGDNSRRGNASRINKLYLEYQIPTPA